MQPLETALLDLIKKLQLQPAGTNKFFGKVGGFPLGLEVILNDQTTGLLFHIRHPLKREKWPAGKELAGDELQTLITAGTADFELEDRIAWLNFFSASTLIQEDRIGPLLVETFSRMKAEGCNGEDICHECQKESATAVSFEEGRVQLICGSCDTRAKKAVELNPNNLPFILGIGSVSALAGAFCWAVLWTLYDRGFTWLDTKNIGLPIAVLLLIYAGIGFLTALPTTFILKKIPKRGDVVAGWFGAAFGLAAIVMGEIGYIGWLIYRAVDVLSLEVTLKFLGLVFAEYTFWIWLSKGCAAVITAVIAYETVKPRKKLMLS